MCHISHTHAKIPTHLYTCIYLYIFACLVEGVVGGCDLFSIFLMPSHTHTHTHACSFTCLVEGVVGGCDLLSHSLHGLVGAEVLHALSLRKGLWAWTLGGAPVSHCLLFPAPASQNAPPRSAGSCHAHSSQEPRPAFPGILSG